MLIRLSADQTDFFELSGADFFLVLLLQLVLVPLVVLVALVLVPLVLLVLEGFPSRTVSAQPHLYSMCNCQDTEGTLSCILYLRTCTFCRRRPILASTLHNTSTFSKCLFHLLR